MRIPTKTGRDDSGLTLVELIFYMAAMMIFSYVVGSLLDGVNSSAVQLSSSTITHEQARTLLDSLEAQLEGAQPVGWCQDPPLVSTATLASEYLGTSLSSCGEPTNSLLPEDVAASEGAGFYPSPSACGTYEPSTSSDQAAVVVATPSCVGFFSYDFEAPIGAVSSVTGVASVEAGTLNPPNLVYVVVSSSSMYMYVYQPTSSSSYTDVTYKSSPSATMYIGAVTSASPFSYVISCTSGSSCVGDEETVSSTTNYDQIQTVSAKVNVSYPNGSARSYSLSLAVPLGIEANLEGGATSANG